jgi:hypothetical protein
LHKIAAAMNKNYDPGRYSSASYDQYLCLRPPLLLWAAVLYLSRAISLPLVLGIGSLGGGTSDTMDMVHGLFGYHTVGSSFVAFPVLCAFAVRSPDAGRWVRWTFAHGRVLLAAAAAVDAVLTLTGVTLASVENADARVAASLFGTVIDGYLLGYLLLSKRVRDVFSDFPLAGI